VAQSCFNVYKRPRGNKTVSDSVWTTQVDPSYLSPHVEFVQRLEGATKHYGVSVLMTDAFYDILPPKVEPRPLDPWTLARRLSVCIHEWEKFAIFGGGQKGAAPATTHGPRASIQEKMTLFLALREQVQRLCRCIDRVKEKGNRIPTDIYTYDFCNFSLEGGSMPNITHRPERTFWEQFPPSSRSSFRRKFKVGLRQAWHSQCCRTNPPQWLKVGLRQAWHLKFPLLNAKPKH
jgi:hypothetical protein